jgi:hypothetical protein
MTRPKSESSEKENAFYNTLLNAWVTTRIDKDKTLLTLSTGGIGILLTFITLRFINNTFQFVAFSVAVSCFLIAIIAVLLVFIRNAKYLEKMLKGTFESDPCLERLDIIAFTSFVAGVIFSIVLVYGGLSAMTNSNKDGSINKVDQHGDVQKSLDGLHNLRPSTPQAPSSSPSSSPAPAQNAPAQSPQQQAPDKGK